MLKDKDNSNGHMDISDSLPSLQFETALTAEQSLLLPLRSRAHCSTTGCLVSACYLVSVMNATRKEVFVAKNKTRAAQRIMQMGIDGKLNVLFGLFSRIVCLLNRISVQSMCEQSLSDPQFVDFEESEKVKLFTDNLIWTNLSEVS